MTQFLTQSSPIPPYMAFPRFLLDKDGLNETAKILYTILLDRARLSQKNDGWTDEQGHVFIFFPIKSLAETMHKSEMSVKTALNALEKENLIARKRQGAGFPNRIYVKYPPEALNQTDRIFSVKQTENCPTDGQKTVSVTDRKLSSSNKEKNNIKRTNSESKDDRTAYGSYQNVFLSTEELKALKNGLNCNRHIQTSMRTTSTDCRPIWHPAENSIPVTQPPYEAGHCVTILLLSNEPMNVRRMKAYETNQ